MADSSFTISNITTKVLASMLVVHTSCSVYLEGIPTRKHVKYPKPSTHALQGGMDKNGNLINVFS